MIRADHRRGPRRPPPRPPPGRSASRRTATGWAPCVRAIWSLRRQSRGASGGDATMGGRGWWRRLRRGAVMLVVVAAGGAYVGWYAFFREEPQPPFTSADARFK